MEPTDLTDIIQLIDFLPPKLRAFAFVFLTLLGLLGVCALILRGVIVIALGSPTPNDPPWKREAFARLAWVDALGLNFGTISQLLEITHKEKVIRNLQVTLPRPEDVTVAWNKTPTDPPPAGGAQ